MNRGTLGRGTPPASLRHPAARTALGRAAEPASGGFRERSSRGKSPIYLEIQEGIRQIRGLWGTGFGGGHGPHAWERRMPEAWLRSCGYEGQLGGPARLIPRRAGDRGCRAVYPRSRIPGFHAARNCPGRSAPFAASLVKTTLHVKLRAGGGPIGYPGQGGDFSVQARQGPIFRARNCFHAALDVLCDLK